MKIKLYTISDDERKVEKILKNEIEYDCILKDSTNIKNPIISLSAGNEIFTHNYAYIEFFNRFYYIDNINVVRNNYFELSLRCDVLMSYKDSIYESSGIISRQENIGQDNLVDEMQPVYNYKETTIKKFPYPVGDKDNLQFILSIAGSN